MAQLRIPLAENSVLKEVIESGNLFHGRANDAVLAAHLYAKVGPPARSDILLLPLRTENRTAALIYGDFGEQENVSAHLDAVQILAEFAGMAFELALERRRRASRNPERSGQSDHDRAVGG